MSMISDSNVPKVAESDEEYQIGNSKELEACSICGWWVVSHKRVQAFGPDGQSWLHRAWGTLRNLDLTDISTPIDQLRAYLIVKYGDRSHIHPRKFEEIVAGVFSDFGYRVRLTSFSGDEGIDIVILDGDGKDVVGVQVKRYAKKIEAEQIRSFTGALVLAGITNGIFVTTSTFRSGAVKTAEHSSSIGVPITLWNARTFYEQLTLSQRPMYTGPDDPSAPFYELWKNTHQLPMVHQNGWGY